MPWIHRAGVQADFARIPNAALRDRRLSYAARGVLAEILSHPDDWKTSAAAMAVQAAKVGEGRYGMAAIFRELKAAGYVRYEISRGPGGRFITHVHIYDAPSPAVDDVSAGRTGNRSAAGRSPGNPAAGSPPSGKPPADTSASRGSPRRLRTKTENEDRSNEDVIPAGTRDRAGGPRPGDDDLIEIAINELAASGRKTVSREDAAEAVRQVLAGRTVAAAARGAYIAQAIRTSPEKYLPRKSGPPRYRGGKFIE